MKTQYIITAFNAIDNIKYFLHSDNRLYWNIINIDKVQLKIYKNLQCAKNKLHSLKKENYTFNIETI